MKPAKNVVFLSGLEHRCVPGYAYLYAGEDGKVRHVAPTGKIISPHEKEFKTTKGSYLYVDVVNDDFTKVTKGVHQLVCAAWENNPSTPEVTYEPNHLNGNKHDNRPSNLKWETRSGNIQHAYNTGMCSQGLRIEVLDIVSKETLSFNTLSHCARTLGIGRNQLRTVIARHRSKPWNERYVFKIDESSDKKIDRHQRQAVKVMDYVNGRISIFGSFTEASVETGVKNMTIRWIAVKKTGSLISGYNFKLLNDDSPWPVKTDQEVALSIVKFPRIG